MKRNRQTFQINNETITIQVQKQFPSKNPHTNEETNVIIGFDVANGDSISVEQYADKTMFSRKPKTGKVINIWI